MKYKLNRSKTFLLAIIAFASIGSAGCYTEAEVDRKIADVRTAEKQRCDLQIDSVKAENERKIESVKAQYEKQIKEKAASAYWSGLTVGLLVAFGGGLLLIALIGFAVWAAYMGKTFFASGSAE